MPWGMLGVSLLTTALALAFGVRRFAKMERSFADVI
jgi:hypothetical protein